MVRNDRKADGGGEYEEKGGDEEDKGRRSLKWLLIYSVELGQNLSNWKRIGKLHLDPCKVYYLKIIGRNFPKHKPEMPRLPARPIQSKQDQWARS